MSGMATMLRGDSARAGTNRNFSVFCFVAFMTLITVGIDWFQAAQEGAVGQGSIVNQLAYVGIFVTLVLTAVARDVRLLLCVPAGITLLLGYCFLSTLWAVAPLISLRRVMLTGVVMWIAFRLVDSLGQDRLLKLLRQVLIVILIGNFLAVFLLPNGVHLNVIGEEESVVGSWRGLIAHKNSAGAICGMTILLFLFDNRDFPKPVSVAVVLGAAVFLYFSHSRTSQGAVLMSVMMGVLIRRYNPSHRVFVGVMLLILALVGLQILADSSRALDDFLNGPNPLTGRTAIWPLLLEYAAQHPWTGAGFGSFWLIGDNSPIWTLTSGWVAQYGSHGHNGYLDLLVTIGIPGLLLAIVTLILWPLARLLFGLSIARPRRSLLLALMIFCVASNLTESSLFSAAHCVNVMMMFTIGIIYRESRSIKRSRVLARLAMARSPKRAAHPMLRRAASRRAA